MKRIIAAPLHASQLRADQRHRQQRRQNFRGATPSLACAAARCWRAKARISASAAEQRRRSCARRKYRLPTDAVALAHPAAHKAAGVPRVRAKIAQDPADGAWRCRHPAQTSPPSRRPRREFQPPSRTAAIACDGVEFQDRPKSPSARRRDRRLCASIKASSGVDHKSVARQRLTQRRRYRMRGRLAVALARKRLAPPLQADFTRHRLARQIAHPRRSRH